MNIILNYFMCIYIVCMSGCGENCEHIYHFSRHLLIQYFSFLSWDEQFLFLFFKHKLVQPVRSCVTYSPIQKCVIYTNALTSMHININYSHFIIKLILIIVTSGGRKSCETCYLLLVLLTRCWLRWEIFIAQL